MFGRRSSSAAQKDWEGLDQLLKQTRFWIDVHEHLSYHTQTHRPDAPRYGLPYLDGNRLEFPDHPQAVPKASDAWGRHAIVHDRGEYTLVGSSDTFVDKPEFSSPRFEYTAKYFFYFYSGGCVRRSKLMHHEIDVLGVQVLGDRLARGWEMVPDPASENTIFRHIKDPVVSCYASAEYQTAPTFYVDKSWRELTRLCGGNYYSYAVSGPPR